MATAHLNSDRPWMTALEMQFAAMGWIAEHTEANSLGRNLQLSCLKEAVAYSWNTDPTTAVALAARTVPDGTRMPEALPSRAGWWYFGITEHLPFHALMWSAHSDDSVFWTLYQHDTEDIKEASKGDVRTFFRPQPIRSGFWQRDQSLAEAVQTQAKVRVGDLVGDKEVEASGHLAADKTAPFIPMALRVLTAGFSWLSQRILTSSSGHIERHRRKQLARENDAVVSDVKVIQLRRTESQPHGKSENAEAVEWSCRWIVNGHWRNQPYANGEHKLIYILPYVKGPDDKPLKVPTHTVYSVNR